MPTFYIRVTGLSEVLDQFENLPENLEPAITKGLTIAASEVVNQVDDAISTAYPPASSPGEPPHLRTGALLRSVRIESVEPFSVTVAAGGEGTLAPYAGYLEFGTSNMEPRPFVKPVIDRITPEIPNIIAEEIDREMQSALR